MKNQILGLNMKRSNNGFLNPWKSNITLIFKDKNQSLKLIYLI